MPCSCFGKKDKKGGGVLGEEEKYRPRDSRERDPPIPAPTTQSQTQPLLAKTPQALGNPPSPSLATTPSTPGGDTRLRPEDDPDKVSRRRDVVASFYSDQCELIDFKTTGSRPNSAHVGGLQDGQGNAQSINPDGPAATSSPATSSPSSTRSGAFCRADLAEKRREFFRELTLEDDDYSRGGSRPTSRLTDPGSQQTPRNSHYQDQLHHTLPHLNKTSPRSNKFSSTPLVVQHSLHRNSTPVTSSEEQQPLLLHSSPEQSPKIISKKPDHSVSEIPQYPSEDIVSASDSDEIPLLSDEQMYIDSSVSTTMQQLSPDISSLKVADQSNLENRHVDMSHTDATEPTESSKLLVEGYERICEKSAPENSKSSDVALQQSSVIEDSPFNINSELFTPLRPDASCTGSEVINANMSSSEMPLHVDHVEAGLQGIADNNHIEWGITKGKDPFVQLDTLPVESLPQPYDNQFNVEFSHEPSPQTLPVIINETLKEYPNEHGESKTFEITPHSTQMFFENTPEQAPQTIVETTRQFISGSPDEQKTSQTIVETTRQFITGPSDEQNTHKIVETTQQFISVTPDEHDDPPQTIVETTRQFITGIPEDEETHNLVETAEQFLSGIPNEQMIMKTTQQQFVSGDPDDLFSQTVVKTTQQIMSDTPDEMRTQTTVKTTQQSSSFPASVDTFFLTSVEEPDELPDKLLMQTSSTTTTTVSQTQEPRSPLSYLQEEEEEDDVEGMLEPKLPDVPCFGAPPPPSSPPPPLPEGHTMEDPFTSPIAVIPPGEEELLPPAPPTPPADQPQQSSPLFDEHRYEFEANSAPVTAPSPPIPHGEEEEDLPLAPPTPPTPRLDDVQLLPSMENEQLPPTPPTPHREDELPPAPLTPSKEEDKKQLAPASPPAPPTITSSPAVTCGVEIVSSSTLEDDGIGSEIDDALESLEGLSEEGNLERAAASS